MKPGGRRPGERLDEKSRGAKQKRPVRESESAFSQRAIKKGHVLQHVSIGSSGDMVEFEIDFPAKGSYNITLTMAADGEGQSNLITVDGAALTNFTSTTTELTISGFPRICKSTLHFVASVVRIPRACGSSSRIRLPPDAFGARPGRTLPDCRDELRHFLPPAALSRARRSLRRFEWTPNSGFRLSRPSVGRTAFISAT